MGNEGLEMRNEKWDDAPLLAEADVRAIVRLLGQTAAERGGHAEIKRRLMAGLCELIDVDAWVWVMTAKMVPGELPVYVGYQHGGFSDEEMAKFILVQSHPDMARLTEAFAQALQGATGSLPARFSRSFRTTISGRRPRSRSGTPAASTHGV